MKLFFFLVAMTHLFCSSIWAYDTRRALETTRTASVIDWKNADRDLWFDFNEWKNEREYRDENPQWDIAVRDKISNEFVGRMIHCVGRCQIFRNGTFVNGRYLSTVKEGDEIVTDVGSYAWIFLFDGTLVHLAAESSMVFYEINIGLRTNFVYARLNSGALFWMARDQRPIAVTDVRESDSLFSTLPMEEANRAQLTFNPKDLSNVLEHEKSALRNQYVRANELVSENNKWIKKTNSLVFLVFPNGTLSSFGLRAQVIAPLGNKSYIKIHSQNFWNSVVGKSKQKAAQFYFRGFSTDEGRSLDFEQWYEVSVDGRQVSEANNIPLLEWTENIYRRIPTLLIARELLLTKYSKPLFDKSIDNDTLQEKYGYRRWGRMKDNQSDLSLRFSFLKEYTRRVETTNLRMAERLKERYEERGGTIKGVVLDERYYKKAFDAYAIGK